MFGKTLLLSEKTALELADWIKDMFGDNQAADMVGANNTTGADRRMQAFYAVRDCFPGGCSPAAVMEEADRLLAWVNRT